jgi:NAD(P)-dependent dehydrogenase (short-subunit alcohol dehydrogenase family)
VCSDLTESARDVSQTPTHEEIAKTGGISSFMKADVSVELDIVTLIEETLRQYGRLDIMCNNAGVAVGSENPGPIWETEESTWEKTLAINAKGVFLGCKHASKAMIGQEPGPTGDRGWIVNLASILGLVSLPRTGKW